MNAHAHTQRNECVCARLPSPCCLEKWRKNERTRGKMNVQKSAQCDVWWQKFWQERTVLRRDVMQWNALRSDDRSPLMHFVDILKLTFNLEFP
jgi:hypothetical protein